MLYKNKTTSRIQPVGKPDQLNAVSVHKTKKPRSGFLAKVFSFFFTKKKWGWAKPTVLNHPS